MHFEVRVYVAAILANDVETHKEKFLDLAVCEWSCKVAAIRLQLIHRLLLSDGIVGGFCKSLE